MRSIVVIAVILSIAPAQAITLRKDTDRKKAPDFELKNSTGASIRLSDHKGKVVLLDFWATWCGPCKTQIPWLNEFSERYGPDGLVVIGISMDQEGWE